MAKFTIEQHQKRIRGVLNPTPVNTSLMSKLKAAALKGRKK